MDAEPAAPLVHVENDTRITRRRQYEDPGLMQVVPELSYETANCLSGGSRTPVGTGSTLDQQAAIGPEERSRSEL